MKIKKRTSVTVETFESIVVQLNQTQTKIFCANCQKSVSELTVDKIVSAQAISDNEDVYLFITDSGLCFFLEIL